MTQVVTVHTDFTDLNQMAQGLVGRVDPMKLILPGPEAVDIGEWVQFAITLQDGTPGFAGVGRCVTAVDNGEERSSHQRFDVVIDSLQFDTRGQQVFEHILLLSGYSGDEGADNVDSDDVADQDPEDLAAEFTGSQIEVPMDALNEVSPEYEDDDQATMVGESPLDLASAMAIENVLVEDDEAVETGEPTTADHALSEPATGNHGVAMPPQTPTLTPQRNGARAGAAMFAYASGLPFPKVPPRPSLDPNHRVSPAPRPSKG